MSKSSNGTSQYVNNFTRERDASKSAVAEIRRLSSMSGKKDLSDLQIPTITENAEDVTGRLSIVGREGIKFDLI